MRASLAEAAQQAVAMGFGMLRIAEEMTWTLAAGIGAEQVVQYEALSNDTFFAAQPALDLCLYDRQRFGPDLLASVLRCHPLIVVDQHLRQNIYYEPPALILDRASWSDRLDWMLSRLSQYAPLA